MKFRIYPAKSDVLALFLSRLEKVEARINEPQGLIYSPTDATGKAYAEAERDALREEIALIQSHGPAEIAVELDDQR